MTMPRSSLVSLTDTPWYHVVCRCVRRAFLCGEDHTTGQNFEHRRSWIEERIGQLSSVFAIDVAAYTVMSNHYHLVVRIDDERVQEWSDYEVLKRWTKIFAGPLFVQRYLDKDQRENLSDAQLSQVDKYIELYRQRLCDLSWYMRVLNETIARKANAEDNCTGRFWEGRFKSQALLDEQAVLMAMSYVDLNPVRACIADTPEESPHTSIAKRLQKQGTSTVPQQSTHQTPAPQPEPLVPTPQNPSHKTGALRCEESLSQLPVAPLMPFEPTETLASSIPFSFEDYTELVDHLGRAEAPGKRGRIDSQTPAILKRLGMNAEEFISHSDELLQTFSHAIGAPDKLIELAAHKNNRYLHGIARARKLYQEERVA
jgi:REP element-mobilizing transposase RayT